MRGETQVVTLAPDGTDPRWLSQVASYDGLKYSYANPGGCAALSAVFRKPPRWRNDTLNPGRLVRAVRGASIVWRGIMDEPDDDDSGWGFSAHGAGGHGDDYLAIWTGTWGTGVFDNAVNAAVARGLDWVNPGIGSPAGIWTGQQVDSGAQTITDLLNLGCHKGGLTWTVTSSARGNVLSVYPLPTTANRILVSTAPENRSIDAGPNVLYARYQSSADAATAATYGLTSVTNAADVTAHGRREGLMDISSAGTYTAAAAQGVASSVEQRYQRAGFTDAFVVQRGELLTMGGAEADLGSFWADGITAMVCKLWMGDYSYGGEPNPGATSFLVGGYEYDEDSSSAAVTPFENARHDFSTLLQDAIDATPVRPGPVAEGKRKKKKK